MGYVLYVTSEDAASSIPRRSRKTPIVVFAGTLFLRLSAEGYCFNPSSTYTTKVLIFKIQNSNMMNWSHKGLEFENSVFSEKQTTDDGVKQSPVSEICRFFKKCKIRAASRQHLLNSLQFQQRLRIHKRSCNVLKAKNQELKKFEGF